MDTIEKASRRVKQVIDNELGDLLKWAGSQTPQENEYTLSTWVPRHLRGLLKFVNDLRLGEGKGQNGRRMQEEISKIDKAIAKGLSPYDRKKYIAKVTYMRILGVEVPIGYQEGLRLMASDSLWDKQIGYLYVSLVFDNKPDIQRLVVQCLQNDLQQQALSHPYVHQLALNLTAHFQNPEISHHISHTLDKFLCCNDSISGTQQSAALCQDVIVTIDPDSVTNGKWFQQVFSWLESGSCDTASTVLSLVKTLITTKRNEFGVCIPQLLIYFQDTVKKLQYSATNTSYYNSRVSPQGFVELFEIFGSVPLNNAEESTLTECIKQLLLYVAAVRDPPRFKKVTDELETGFTESPMFGQSYEWLKKASSYRQETVVFAALRLVFKRLSSLELMKEGLDYYARYLRDDKEMTKKWALSEVLQYVSASEAGFALLKSRERWSIPALMECLKNEFSDDIRNDLCGLCFKLSTLPEESNLLCQKILEFVRRQLSGLNVGRRYFRRSCSAIRKIVDIVPEICIYGY
ncbi:AP-2 complex subunit alpha-2-like isoform X2 [Paramacrobiotus metropolitanus]|uniref:AP-2 complex subunit alpha-2-like isoform X2 n=1 Tax=Paramacrobiotus metropolitanus TaxID=2943436 RepID=UPI00244601FC|nr:AP-2 complex subunit alpha-2-like isoform X2 [Paramacrobiotus metropolitanus]